MRRCFDSVLRFFQGFTKGQIIKIVIIIVVICLLAALAITFAVEEDSFQFLYDVKELNNSLSESLYVDQASSRSDCENLCQQKYDECECRCFTFNASGCFLG